MATKGPRAATKGLLPRGVLACCCPETARTGVWCKPFVKSPAAPTGASLSGGRGGGGPGRGCGSWSGAGGWTSDRRRRGGCCGDGRGGSGPGSGSGFSDGAGRCPRHHRRAPGYSSDRASGASCRAARTFGCCFHGSPGRGSGCGLHSARPRGRRGGSCSGACATTSRGGCRRCGARGTPRSHSGCSHAAPRTPPPPSPSHPQNQHRPQERRQLRTAQRAGPLPLSPRRVSPPAPAPPSAAGLLLHRCPGPEAGARRAAPAAQAAPLRPARSQCR